MIKQFTTFQLVYYSLEFIRRTLFYTAGPGIIDERLNPLSRNYWNKKRVQYITSPPRAGCETK